MKLGRDFFERDPTIVARELLGCSLVRDEIIVGQIVETEAYGDATDLASHARFGITKRNKIMYGPAGLLYVYSIYGIFELTNIICGQEGKAGAVLLRSAEITQGVNLVRSNLERNKFVKTNDLLATGPGKLSIAFGISREENGLDITTSDQIFILKPGDGHKRAKSDIIETKRVGVDYAKDSKDLHWRYYIKNNKYVSKK